MTEIIGVDHAKVEIAEAVEKRLKGYNRSKNLSWEKIKKKHGI